MSKFAPSFPMNPYLVALVINRLWYALPLIVVISLVYGATRHELPLPILKRSLGIGSSIVVFMLVILAIIAFELYRFWYVLPLIVVIGIIYKAIGIIYQKIRRL